MDQQNQQPSSNDEQTVISAMRLLARNLPPPQREKVFSILAREQEEYTQATPMEHHSDEVPGAEPLVYPVQPLMLGSNEGHASSLEQTTEVPMGEGHNEHHMEDAPHEDYQEAGTERGYNERIPFVPLLLPLAASFSPRQWIGRFLVIALFLCALSLSTLAAYHAGMRTASATPASPVNANCLRGHVIVTERRFWGNGFSHKIIVEGNPQGQVFNSPVDEDDDNDASFTTTWIVSQNDFVGQCGVMHHGGFDRHFGH